MESETLSVPVLLIKLPRIYWSAGDRSMGELGAVAAARQVEKRSNCRGEALRPLEMAGHTSAPLSRPTHLVRQECATVGQPHLIRIQMYTIVRGVV